MKVTPQNLTSIECDGRQTPERSTNLDYLEARSPERIALIRDIAQKLDRNAEDIEREAYNSWAKHHEPFDRQTLEILAEIEKIGSYSIAQMELIGDCIRGSSEDFKHSSVCASEVKGMVAAGDEFHNTIRKLAKCGKLSDFSPEM